MNAYMFTSLLFPDKHASPTPNKISIISYSIFRKKPCRSNHIFNSAPPHFSGPYASNVSEPKIIHIPNNAAYKVVYGVSKS